MQWSNLSQVGHTMGIRHDGESRVYLMTIFHGNFMEISCWMYLDVVICSQCTCQRSFAFFLANRAFATASCIFF